MADELNERIGKLVEGKAYRDAIHVPVVPVMAGAYQLHPGEKVTLDGVGCAVPANPMSGKAVGVVDPFLDGPVGTGERFWLFVRPGTTRALRHAWSHPAFDVRVPSDG